ncbi:hypothetical protein ACIRLA_46320 [Streptomyces sp. NPDC102364]|uniref:hypothetical protein n=1 Tax=Streptomyces sp. NPDC102364 TaxID=3366161 RepID=UPI003801A5F2
MTPNQVRALVYPFGAIASGLGLLRADVGPMKWAVWAAGVAVMAAEAATARRRGRA